VQPNAFGWVMIVLFVGALFVGIGVWAFQIFLTVRHFVFLRRACADRRQFFELFRVGSRDRVLALLTPEGRRNLQLSLDLHRIDLPLAIAGGMIFVAGLIWGGWS